MIARFKYRYFFLIFYLILFITLFNFTVWNHPVVKAKKGLTELMDSIIKNKFDYNCFTNIDSGKMRDIKNILNQYYSKDSANRPFDSSYLFQQNVIGYKNQIIVVNDYWVLKPSPYRVGLGSFIHKAESEYLLIEGKKVIFQELNILNHSTISSIFCDKETITRFDLEFNAQNSDEFVNVNILKKKIIVENNKLKIESDRQYFGNGSVKDLFQMAESGQKFHLHIGNIEYIND